MNSRHPKSPKPHPVTKPYRVLIADDHPLVRQGLRAALARRSDAEVCGEASNGCEAVELVRTLKPDLVLLDLTMPKMDGLEAARLIHAESPNTVILVLTMHFSKEIARQVLRCGARGYILKSDAETDLAAAVDQIRRGQPVFAAKLAATMVESFVNGESDPIEIEKEDPLPGFPLNKREVEIITLLAQGKSNKALAIALALSTRTIEGHRHRIMHKMKFENFSDLVRFAVRNRLVQA